jgi:COMPASS component SWD1
MEWSLDKREFVFSYRPEGQFVYAAYFGGLQGVLIVEDLQVKLLRMVNDPQNEHVRFEEPISAAAIFDPESILLLGNGKGEVIFIKLDPTIGLLILSKQADLGSSILQIVCHRQKALVLMNFKDRAIRSYQLQTQPVPTLTFRHKFLDAINRVPYQSIGFNHDGEQAFGAIKSKGNHSICLWDLAHGTILKTLEGPREDCMEVKWHPKRPILVSLSKFGIAYVWRPVYPKKWSALFPGLEELEENVEYIEREDEFDDEDIDACAPNGDSGAKEADEIEQDIDIHSPLPVITEEDLADIRLFL